MPPIFCASEGKLRDIVRDIFRDELKGGCPAVDERTGRHTHFRDRVNLLEYSCYLENYLWPNFDAVAAPFDHVTSIVIMLNAKMAEGLQPWRALARSDDASEARAGTTAARFASLVQQLRAHIGHGRDWRRPWPPRHGK